MQDYFFWCPQGQYDMHDELVYRLVYHFWGKTEYIMYRVCSVRLLIHAVTSSPKKSSWRKALKAKLFAGSLLHWRYSLYGEVLAAINSPSLHYIWHPLAHLLSLSFSLSLYPYFYYSLLFAPHHCLSVLSIPLIPSSLSSQMRWSGPGLAIPFPSNLCPSPSPVAWFAHFMNWNVSMAGIPLSIRPARHPRAVVPPWTHHQPRWPWRQAAYACARAPARSK